MALHIRASAAVPHPIREFRWHHTRQWRFDFAWPQLRLALEVEGGTWMPKGRHTTGAGFEADCEKYNAAAISGWRVLRVTGGMVRSGHALTILERALTRIVRDGGQP